MPRASARLQSVLAGPLQQLHVRRRVGRLGFYSGVRRPTSPTECPPFPQPMKNIATMGGGERRGRKGKRPHLPKSCPSSERRHSRGGGGGWGRALSLRELRNGRNIRNWKDTEAPHALPSFFGRGLQRPSAQRPRARLAAALGEVRRWAALRSSPLRGGAGKGSGRAGGGRQAAS